MRGIVCFRATARPLSSKKQTIPLTLPASLTLRWAPPSPPRGEGLKRSNGTLGGIGLWCVTILTAGLALFLSIGSAAAEQYRDWSLTCPAAAGALCGLETAARNRDQEPGTRLTMTRPETGAVQEIALQADKAVLTRRFPLLLRVDSNKPLRLTLGEGVKADADGKLRITDPALIGKILGQMRPGRRVRLEFYDQGGRSRFAIFSLMGLTAALGEAAASQSARRTETAAPEAPAKPRRKQSTELRPPPDSAPAGRTRPDGTVFTPRGKLPPPSDCYDHQRSLDGTGRFLGWVSTNRC